MECHIGDVLLLDAYVVVTRAEVGLCEELRNIEVI